MLSFEDKTNYYFSKESQSNKLNEFRNKHALFFSQILHTSQSKIKLNNLVSEEVVTKAEVIERKVEGTNSEERKTMLMPSASIDQNEKYQKIDNTKIIQRFKELSRFDIIEDGMYTESQKFLYSLAERERDPYSFISGIFQQMSYLAIRNNEFKVLFSILHIMSHYTDKQINESYGDVFILSTLFSHEKDLLKEAAIKVFENWNKKEHAEFLKKFEIKTKWIDNYRQDVIEFLENEGV